jgi:hypothetical protein
MDDDSVFRCLPPCPKIFNTQKKLILHYKNRPPCKAQWKEYERTLAVAAFEEASSQRRAQVRNSVTVETLRDDEEGRRGNGTESKCART